MNIVNSMVLPTSYCQNTINHPVTFSGVGIHSGKVVNMKLLPAVEDSGIVFKRTDLEFNNEIKVCIENISNSKFCSKLENENNVSVSTVEHLLATLHSLSIDNVIVEIDSSELPAMDGSSCEFTYKLLEVGKKTQKKSKKILRVLKKIKIEMQNRSTAVAIRHEIILLIIGGLFVLETVSVIIQVVSYKLTGKRIFRMAPLHHHFEQKGWAESTIVIRFWIISVILALIGLSSLKLR